MYLRSTYTFDINMYVSVQARNSVTFLIMFFGAYLIRALTPRKGAFNIVGKYNTTSQRVFYGLRVKS